MRRGIAHLVGHRIRSVERLPCHVKPIAISPGMTTFRRRVVGNRIVNVGRIGKRVVLDLENDDHMIFEPRMTGLVLLTDPPTLEHLRFRVDLAGGETKSIWYWDRRGLGSVRLLSSRQFSQQLGSNKFGPDALVVTAEALRDSLRSSRRAVKVALLDQRIVAGIGNLYASEILHLARIHPAKRCDLLTKAQWQRIVEATHAILNEAIRYEGSTLSDGTYRNALNKAGGYQNHHQVYNRADLPCPRCEQAAIVRIVQTQRSTYFCPACQRKNNR